MAAVFSPRRYAQIGTGKRFVRRVAVPAAIVRALICQRWVSNFLYRENCCSAVDPVEGEDE
jgi:hypothetical protein